MVTLRVVRHDLEQVLAECQSVVVPASGEVLQLDVRPYRSKRLEYVTTVTYAFTMPDGRHFLMMFPAASEVELRHDW